MCIILAKPTKAKLDPAFVVEMKYTSTNPGSAGNKDGVGVMYVEDGRVKVERKVTPTDKEIEEYYALIAEKRGVLHVRNQSVGAINLDNVHPFCVLNKDWGDPIDLWMMHNGTIRNIQVRGDWSDSRNYAEIFVRKMMRETPNTLQKPGAMYHWGGLIENNKLVFLDSKNRISIVNYGLGRKLPNGCWVSTDKPIRAWKRNDATHKNALAGEPVNKVVSVASVSAGASESNLPPGAFRPGSDGKKRWASETAASDDDKEGHMSTQASKPTGNNSSTSGATGSAKTEPRSSGNDFKRNGEKDTKIISIQADDDSPLSMAGLKPEEWIGLSRDAISMIIQKCPGDAADLIFENLEHIIAARSNARATAS